MSYRISEEQIRKDQAEFKKEYPPFVPFALNSSDKNKLANKFSSLLVTQNGMDTDDYCVNDNNKVETYLKDVKPGSTVLLLGTGTGREVLVAKEMGFLAIGTTLGSRNVYFGHKFLRLGPSELVECANEVLPFRNNSFDVVAGFQVFEHAIAPFLFLMELRRVLKYGGRVLMEWPPASDYHMGQNPHHQVCYCPGQAESLLQKACFENIKSYYSNLQPIPDDEVWSARNHGHMLCVEGIKSRAEQDFVGLYLGA